MSANDPKQTWAELGPLAMNDVSRREAFSPRLYDFSHFKLWNDPFYALDMPGSTVNRKWGTMNATGERRNTAGAKPKTAAHKRNDH